MLSSLHLVYVLLFILSFLIVWEFAGYPLLMTVIALRRKPQSKDYSYQPYVSIIVPTYNEEANIETRICNLYDLDYPRQNYEIVIVDSGSTDGTVGVVQRLIELNKDGDRPQVSLVRESERRGKGAAINLGKSHAKGDIVVVTDANCVFNQDALKELAPHFKDPLVGAVGGRYVVHNPDSALTLSTKYYRDLEHVLRTGEAALCSACLFDGEINAWRKGLMDIDPTMIAEDLDMCIKMRKMGYKIEYEPEAVVCEAVPTTLREQVKQRKRTSIGTITSILNNLTYVMVPKDLYRLLILPSHKSLAMLSPFILLAVPITYLVALDWGEMLVHAAASIIVFSVLFAVLTWGRSLLGASYRTDRISAAAVTRMIWYVLLNEYIILCAWKDVAFGNYSVLWEKATTTRKGGAL
jgi:cellulose synthase/poly-beta-1,6-N-acetylglucosamine synthase-like glycosyltransferase